MSTDTEVLQQTVQQLPDACERLDYVRLKSEQAASKVLGLVEGAQDDAEQVRRQGADLSEMLQRQALAPELGLERARSLLKLCAAYAATAASYAERSKSLHSEIMMAQDFQDLSGQVINKVIKLLREAEAPLQALVGTAGANATPSSEQLQGVQTPDKALKQDDVDDLLASLGF